MAALVTTSGLLQLECPKTPTTTPTAPVPPLILVELHLHSWERSISASLGTLEKWEYQWYLDDPLWDSQGCGSGRNCCDRGGPWFTTTLRQEVNDDVEVGVCLDQESSDEDIGIDQLEVCLLIPLS